MQAVKFYTEQTENTLLERLEMKIVINQYNCPVSSSVCIQNGRQIC